ncbi:MAG TPA: FAD-dependent oxidoreductase [Gemmatimonadaceae bacterium]|nr:FAD-dependent oxidoreductase [Gemmatimonadaceae bacterium]
MATDQDIAFPTLTKSQLETLTARAHPRTVRAGEILFAEGDRDFCFFVVLDGEVHIVEHSRGDEHLVRIHGPAEFTGDVDMLTSRKALVTARAARDGRVLAMSATELRSLVDDIPELNEIIIKAFLMRRTILLSEGFVGARIIGSRFDPKAHVLRDFATRNAIPFRWIDLDGDEGADAILRQLNVPASSTPIVIGRNGEWRSNPSLADFASCAGLTYALDTDHVYDLVVVGAGPAGLAASVYGASEGLDVLTLDSVAAGGQAGTSARIENYLGFPTGISGAELIANARIQAQRFEATISVPCEVRSLGIDGGERIVTLVDGTRIRTRCVLVSSGVEYRKLDVPRFSDFDGAGIYYAATGMEARLCRGEEVVVVGAGNSAGQAIVHLAKEAKHIHVLVRGSSLDAKMSRYLVEQVERLGNATVQLNAKVTGVDGNGRLSAVRYTIADGEERSIATNALFLFIGADANTIWLRGCVELDKKGFVVTGSSLPATLADTERWKAAGRTPFFLETSLPGVFCAGDVRSGSVKRCAAAVGEGSMSVSFVHAHIARPA